jgi:hypothetical protein
MKTIDAAEVSFVSVADQDSESQMDGSCCNLKIVRRNQLPAAPQIDDELGPPLGDLAPEVDERNTCEKLIDAGPGALSLTPIADQPNTDEQLREHDRRQCDGLGTLLVEQSVEARVGALERDERARV